MTDERHDPNEPLTVRWEADVPPEEIAPDFGWKPKGIIRELTLPRWVWDEAAAGRGVTWYGGEDELLVDDDGNVIVRTTHPDCLDET